MDPVKTAQQETPKGAVPLNEEQIIMIAYVNYKGEASVRRIVPKTIYFGSNEWHKEPQWLLKAFDLDKNADRSFAMADIHSWQ